MNDYDLNKIEKIVNQNYSRREILSLIPIKGLIRAIFSSNEEPKKDKVVYECEPQ